MLSNKKEKSEILTLMYHEVTNMPERQKNSRRIDPSYSLLYKKFEMHITYFAENGYTIILPDEKIYHQHDISKKIVLTFDDGLIGNYDYAFPILKKHQFSATIFVALTFISKERYMNWDQLKELSNNGFLIQSHTMTHSPLGELNEKEIFYELSESKKIIEKKLGNEVKYLSLPYGSWNHNVYRIANEIGYKAIFTSSPFNIYANKNPIMIGRIPIKDTFNLDDIHKIISNKSEQLFKMKSIFYLKDKLKKIIGLNNYRRIYRFVNRIKSPR